jgi:D-alanyl-D-alanine dipeptidase
MARTLAGYDYRPFLEPVEQLADLRLPPLEPAPLPLLAPPPTGLVAPVDPAAPGADEPLVRVAHPRVASLALYHAVGWPEATPQTLLRHGVAARLAAAAASLPDGIDLVVLDAWRPPALQRALYAAAYTDPSLPPGFVEPPSDDPTTPPPHCSGGAVDLTLSVDGRPLALGTGFDEFTPRAWTRACESHPGRVRTLRRLLFGTLAAQGFVVADCEWWHFEWGTRHWAALTGAPARYGAIAPKA